MSSRMGMRHARMHACKESVEIDALLFCSRRFWSDAITNDFLKKRSYAALTRLGPMVTWFHSPGSTMFTTLKREVSFLFPFILICMDWTDAFQTIQHAEWSPVCFRKARNYAFCRKCWIAYVFRRRIWTPLMVNWSKMILWVRFSAASLLSSFFLPNLRSSVDLRLSTAPEKSRYRHRRLSVTRL